MNDIRDKFGKVLSEGSFVAYLEDYTVKCGRVVEAFQVGITASEVVRIERMFEDNPSKFLLTRPSHDVIKILLPAT